MPLRAEGYPPELSRYTVFEIFTILRLPREAFTNLHGAASAMTQTDHFHHARALKP